jgi:predicted phosphodiesterase
VKVQIFSDLHTNVCLPRDIAIGRDVDVVAVAGDVAEGAEKSFVALRKIVPMVIPIVFTMGNHEYYRRFFKEELETAKDLGPQFNVHVLENDVVTIGSVRFAGASLWTDYRIFGDCNVPAIMQAARSGMNDHRLIGWKRDPWERFRPQEARMLHEQSRRFFKEAFVSFDGTTIAISHHAPDLRSLPERYASSSLSAAFVSNTLRELFDDGASGHVDLWIHGHLHESADYRVGNTRVICNPHGYAAENPNFKSNLVVEVDA